MEDDEFVFIENDISQSTWVDVKKSPTLNKQQQVQQQEQPTLPVYRIVAPLIEEEIVPQQQVQVEQVQQVEQQKLEPEILQVKEEEIIVRLEEQQVPVIVSIIESPLPISLPVQQQQQDEPEWLKGKEKTSYTSVIPLDVKYTSSNVSAKPYITSFSSPTSNRTTTSSSVIGSGMRRISLAQLNGEIDAKPYTSSDSTVKSFTTASKSNNSYSYAF